MSRLSATLALALLTLSLAVPPASAASAADFDVVSPRCELTGASALPPAAASAFCQVRAIGTFSVDPATCTQAGCAISVDVLAEESSAPWAPGYSAIPLTYRHIEAYLYLPTQGPQDLACAQTRDQIDPILRTICGGQAELFVPLAPGACRYVVAAAYFQGESIILRMQAFTAANAHLCRDIGGTPSIDGVS